MGAVDLAAERAAALRRREPQERMQVLRTRARMVLAGQWSANEAQIRDTIRERYPKLGDGEVDELLVVTRQVQTEDRPRIDPQAIRVTYQDDPENDLKIKRKVRVKTTEEAPAPPKPRKVDLGKDLDARGKVMAVRDRVMAEPKPTAPKIKAAVAEELGIDLSDSQAHALRYGNFRKRSKNGTGKKAPATSTPPVSVQIEKPSNGAAAPVVPPPERDSDQINRAALLQEVRSLRTTYEGEDFVRLEREDDRWVVRAQLTFDNRSAASSAAAALLKDEAV